MNLMLLMALGIVGAPSTQSARYFQIRIVDDATGRGVPLVELRTVNNVAFVTDSQGVVAIDLPELMHQEVFFHVASHGYEFPADGFGIRGLRARIEPGEHVEWKIHRLNVAERLYRVTGVGIYADSVMLGLPVPIRRPLANAQVAGSDSVMNAVYRGRIYWFWGDTLRLAYPLGNFHVPGATSLLPGRGGLDPAQGVDLEYFTSPDGFAQETCHMAGSGPTWIVGLAALPDANGHEQLLACYVKVKPPLTVYRRGLAAFDDASSTFRHLRDWPDKAPLIPSGHAFVRSEQNQAWLYFASPIPVVRVRATVEDAQNPDRYEAFTCLRRGSGSESSDVERDAAKRPVYAWKPNTAPLTPALQARLLRQGKLAPNEAWIATRDVETDKAVLLHSGSVYWNDFLKRWVLIAVEQFGTSMLGEIWFGAADSPLGPWTYVRKIVTHNKYSFYNPKQHPMLDQQSGRWIYFEGTYTDTFSGNPAATPRYNYNQVMYRLDLSDEQLVLPQPVYASGTDAEGRRYERRPNETGVPDLAQVAFYLPDSPRTGLVPLYAVHRPTGGDRLTTTSPGSHVQPLGYLWPPDMASPPSGAVPLVALINETGTERYGVGPDARPRPGERSHTLGWLWREPRRD